MTARQPRHRASARLSGLAVPGCVPCVRMMADPWNAPEAAAALDRLQAERGLDVDIYVDGASGGFLAPFCAPG